MLNRFLLIKSALLFLFVFFSLARPDADEGVSRAGRYVADGEVAGLFAEEDGTMFCVSGGASILRIGKNMETIWNRPLSGKPVLISRRRDGIILVAGEGGRAEGYNILGERVIEFSLPWRKSGQEEKPASPLPALGETAEGWIYFCAPDGNFTVFSLKGVPLARWKTSSPPVCAPVLFQEKIVLALEDGSVASYTPSGRPAWDIPSGAPVSRLLVNRFTGGLLVSRGDGGFEVYTAGPAAEAVQTAEAPETAGPSQASQASENPAEIRLLKKLSLPFEAAYILPLSSGAFVFVGTSGRVITITADGLPQEDFFLKDGAPSEAATDGEGTLFFTETRGRLSSYSLAGSPLWTTNLTGKPGPPVLSPSSRYLAVGAQDWVVQRFEFVQYGRTAAARPAPPPAADPLKMTPAQSLYRGEYDFIYLMDRALSSAAERKNECLRVIGGRLEKGLGRSLDYISEVLRCLAAEPYIRQNAKNYPDIQSRALNLLGQIQDQRCADFLSSFLTQEKDSMLLRATLAAMGAQRSDPDEILRRGIYNFTLSLRQDAPDTRLHTAAVDALEALSLYHGSLGSYGRAALMRLHENSPAATRRRIQTLLTTRP
ncbi:MAG: hypothetical protein LBK13_09055 [Spirochaetales bacterium]|jgi:hypothetical protein|nr:hypothetical protein [Spirochaetales bacterium]